jgi:hypothetical protein
MLAINNRTATSIPLSPFFFMHGYNMHFLDLAKEQEELQTTEKAPVA